MEEPKLKKLKKILLIMLILGAMITPSISSMASIKYYSDASATQKTCRIKQECLSATTEENFKILNQVCNRKDEAALKRMIASGQVYILSQKFTIRMLDSGIAKSKIYVTDWDVSVWLSTEYIEY